MSLVDANLVAFRGSKLKGVAFDGINDGRAIIGSCFLKDW